MYQKLFLAACLALTLSGCKQDERTFALIKTDLGTMRVMLYDETPLHRDNFVKLAREGYYDSLLFHRVIQGFMIQGGDPDSKYAGPSQILGMGGPGYQVDNEIGFPHFRGVIAAARDNNPQKRSSGSQFYIVQGSQVTTSLLDQVEAKKKFEYSDAQRKVYIQEGGTPTLDGDYTVFGELVDGFDVLDSIAARPTGPYDRPLRDIRMTVRIDD